MSASASGHGMWRGSEPGFLVGAAGAAAALEANLRGQGYTLVQSNMAGDTGFDPGYIPYFLATKGLDGGAGWVLTTSRVVSGCGGGSLLLVAVTQRRPPTAPPPAAVVIPLSCCSL